MLLYVAVCSIISPFVAVGNKLAVWATSWQQIYFKMGSRATKNNKTYEHK
jgi:hypothetical protein